MKIIKIGSTWCSGCIVMKPIWEEIEKEIKLDTKYYDFDISLILTPGHSDCSYTILIDDLLFTGDFLFKESIGRTDLYTGSSFIMNQSLKKIINLDLLKKNEDYYIYPGHGDYTTLNYEKKYNYYLKMIK